jgi:hypothetical protein
MPFSAWMFAIAIAAAMVAIVLLLQTPRFNALFHSHIPDIPRRRLLLAATGFFITFAAARAVAYAAMRDLGPFHYLYFRGTHIHHLVFGIVLLLVVGFCWLLEIGTGARGTSLFASRLMSLLYGVAAALTLDEVSIWLRVQEGVYWTHRDFISIDAVILFGAALLIGIYGHGFLKALGLEIFRSGGKAERKPHHSTSRHASK